MSWEGGVPPVRPSRACVGGRGVGQVRLVRPSCVGGTLIR